LKKSFAQQRIFIKRSIFKKVGLFNTSYKIYADYDWLLSTYDNIMAMHFINRYFALMYSQGASYKQFKYAKKEKFAIIKKNYPVFIYLGYLFRHYLWVSLVYRLKKLYDKFKIFFKHRER